MFYGKILYTWDIINCVFKIFCLFLKNKVQFNLQVFNFLLNNEYILLLKNYFQSYVYI